MLELNFILSFLFARLASVNINALDVPLPIASSGAYFFKPASISHVAGLAIQRSASESSDIASSTSVALFAQMPASLPQRIAI
jgi:hypothetical protein